MDSPGSARGDVSSRLPVHLQQPSSSSFSDPEVFTSTHNIRPGQTFVSVQTLTKESFHVAVSSKTKVHDVLWKCGERLSLSEDKLFGLAFRQPTEGIGGDQPRHEYYFLDPAAKIMKYAHKQPRFANWHSKSSENRPILVLYFRVRVYIDQVGLLTCPKAREHYYLQLKDNFLDHWAGRNSVSEERCWYMAALALITDKGTDYLGYFRAEQYFPLWVINERGLEYIRNNLPAACEDIINEGRYKAMEKFMIEAGRSPFALNCHLYGLRRHKMDNTDNAVLGINAKGIEMCDIGEDGDRIPLRSLTWSRVAKLSFNRKKMTIIGSDGTKMSLYAQTEHKARYLLELCKAVHQTLLVMSHLHATMAPPPKPYLEMSVDGISTSSTSGIGSGDHDKDSDSLSSACGDRCHGSMSSKLRLRIKMDSNLDVKIEKMELDHIRQERAASQSSKASDESERSRLELRYQTYHPAHESSGATSSTYTVTTPQDTTTRPSSMDNASQTIESGSTRSIVDVNFNNKNRERHESSTSTSGTHVAFSSKDVTMPTESTVVSSSIAMNQPLDTDTTQSINDRLLSMSASDLRAMAERSYSPPAQWNTNAPSTGSSSPPEMMPRDKMTRSETRIDSQYHEMWLNHQIEGFNGAIGGTGGRFVKKNSAGNRNANAINRVHSMPSHYHVNGYYRNNNQMLSTYEDAAMHHGPTSLTHAHSLHVPGTVARPRNPPPYEFPAPATFAVGPKQSSSPPPQAMTQTHNQTTSSAAPVPTGPLPAEIAGDRQASFPPASVTPTQFLEETGSFSTEKMQNYPLILQLLKEHRQSQGQLNNIPKTRNGMTNGFYGNSPAGILSHNRRPSSCIDLSSLDGGVINGGSFVLPTHRGDYFLDSATLSQNLHLPSFVPMIASTTTASSTTMTSSVISTQSHQPQPHPSQQLHHQQSVKSTNNFARIEQHNGNLILPPPPPYQQPQQLVN